MPRPRRFILPGQPQHIIHRGNNRQDIFFGGADRVRFLSYLETAAGHHGCDIHAYALMTNHIHLLVTPRQRASLPGMMQSLGRRYAGYVNATQERTGTLWEGRYRASVIDSEAYLFTCQRYIELNPVRAGLVRDPGAYPWSSFATNAEGAENPLITPHPLYLALGDDAQARRAAYAGLFAEAIEAAALKAIRSSVNRGAGLGNEDFLGRMEAATGRSIGPRPIGRPGGVTKGTKGVRDN